MYIALNVIPLYCSTWLAFSFQIAFRTKLPPNTVKLGSYAPVKQSWTESPSSTLASSPHLDRAEWTPVREEEAPAAPVPPPRLLALAVPVAPPSPLASRL